MDETLSAASVWRQLPGARLLQALDNGLQRGNNSEPQERTKNALSMGDSIQVQALPSMMHHVQLGQGRCPLSHRLASSICSHNERQRPVELYDVQVVRAEATDALDEQLRNGTGGNARAVLCSLCMCC